jgi:hypothetical protein
MMSLSGCDTLAEVVTMKPDVDHILTVESSDHAKASRRNDYLCIVNVGMFKGSEILWT